MEWIHPGRGLPLLTGGLRDPCKLCRALRSPHHPAPPTLLFPVCSEDLKNLREDRHLAQGHPESWSEPSAATASPSCAEGPAIDRVPGPHQLVTSPLPVSPLGAHLGQPRLGIQDTQEAVGLADQEVQARLPRGRGDGHPGQQLSLTLLLGTDRIWLLTEPTHVPGGPHLSQSWGGPPIS